MTVPLWRSGREILQGGQQYRAAAMIAQGRAPGAAVRIGARQNRQSVRVSKIVCRAGGEDVGASLRKTAKRFGGPSQAGNDAIAEAVRTASKQNVTVFY